MLSVVRAMGFSMGGSKKTSPPFISFRYNLLNSADMEKNKEFPYDIPFLSRREVKELVDLSKQYYLSPLVSLRLRQHPTFPPHLLDKLLPLESLRFFHDEIMYELTERLSPPEYKQWSPLIMEYCSDFSKLKTPLWTWERAKAHLQTKDPLLRRASASDYLWGVWTAAESRGQRLTESTLFQHATMHQLGQNLTPPMWIQHKSRITGVSPETLWEQTLKEQGYDVQELRRTHFKLLQDLAAIKD